MSTLPIMRLAVLFALALTADAHPPAPSVDMIVTVEREAVPREEVPAAVTVLRRDDLDVLPVQTLADALAFVPGITMFFDSGSAGTPMITSRGFFGGGEVEYVKLLVDGMPVGDSESGLADWQRFGLYGIERVEILHGPGSAVHGDTALGGVVQVFTRRTTGLANVRLGAGSFGQRFFEGGAGGEVGSLHLSVRGSWREGDGSRDHAGREDASGAVTLERDVDRARWQLRGSASRLTRHDPGPLTPWELEDSRTRSSELFRFDREDVTRQRLALGFDNFGSTLLRANGFVAQRSSENMRTILLVPGFGTTALRGLDTRDTGLSLDLSRQILGGNVHAGADVTRASVSMGYGDARENGERVSTGVFVSGAWDVCSRCRLILGVRHDAISDDFSSSRRTSQTSPRAGLTLRIVPAVSLFAQLGRAFKSPTVDQLFDPRPYPDFEGGTFTISNADLAPQRATNAEIGMTGEAGSLHWSFAAYRMNVTDEIDFDPRTFSYRNLGSSVHRGVEATVSTARDRRLHAALSYVWTRVADHAVPDHQLKNIPEHTMDAIVRARLPRRIVAAVSYRSRHGLFLDDHGGFPLNGTHRIDLRLSRSFGDGRVELDILNATNRQSDEFGYVLGDGEGRPTPLIYPAAGRSARIALVWFF